MHLQRLTQTGDRLAATQLLRVKKNRHLQRPVKKLDSCSVTTLYVQLSSAEMSVTVCLEAPLQALNHKRRKADVQASILLLFA